MSIRTYLNAEHQEIWWRYFRKAVAQTGDLRQSESLANERTLKTIMRASAAIAHQRMLNQGAVTRQTLPWVK
jgi:hypothetical protein